jgi:hypothetical protein
VLQRGEEDQGNSSIAGVSLPVLDTIRLPKGQSSASLGDELNIEGRNLDGLIAVRFALISSRANGFTPVSLVAPAIALSDKGVKITLPDDAAAQTAWLSGFYTVTAIVQRGQQTWSSNELPLSIGPTITQIQPGNVVARDANGDVSLTLTCTPEVRLARVDDQHMRFDQTVVLLLGSGRQIAPKAPPAPPASPAPAPKSTNTLDFVFHVEPNEVGTYLIRLRVDGVDSVPLDPQSEIPQFADDQKLQVT